jgi:hypothetical protein
MRRSVFSARSMIHGQLLYLSKREDHTLCEESTGRAVSLADLNTEYEPIFAESQGGMSGLNGRLFEFLAAGDRRSPTRCTYQQCLRPWSDELGNKLITILTRWESLGVL